MTEERLAALEAAVERMQAPDPAQFDRAPHLSAFEEQLRRQHAAARERRIREDAEHYAAKQRQREKDRPKRERREAEIAKRDSEIGSLRAEIASLQARLEGLVIERNAHERRPL